MHSTIKIQAYVRGFLTRTQCKQNERQNFDNIYPKTEDYNEVLLYTLLTKILFFYNEKKDINRLVRTRTSIKNYKTCKNLHSLVPFTVFKIIAHKYQRKIINYGKKY